jgi:hypothetical protein
MEDGSCIAGSWRRLAGQATVAAACVSCSDGLLSSERLQQAVVYGVDGRREYYEAADPRIQQRFARSSVALIADRYIGGTAPPYLTANTPTWGESHDVCPDEAFADQPAVAFCSGVLVDWDLVLTAGHCVRLLALADFSIAFGYYYTQSGKLALSSGDLVRPTQIVAEALDPDGVVPRLDFAWLRLEHPVDARFQPVPFYSQLPLLHANDPVVPIGSPGGVPLKFDDSGSIAEVRDAGDFFIATTDTSAGWSGGAAYDVDLVLTGFLSRGASDLIDSPKGCRVTVHAPAEAPAEEHFTYAARAVHALCDKEPSRAICAADCGDICQAPAEPETPAQPAHGPAVNGGCSFTPCTGNGPLEALALFFVGIVVSRRKARRH